MLIFEVLIGMFVAFMIYATIDAFRTSPAAVATISDEPRRFAPGTSSTDEDVEAAAPELAEPATSNREFRLPSLTR